MIESLRFAAQRSKRSVGDRKGWADRGPQRPREADRRGHQDDHGRL